MTENYKLLKTHEHTHTRIAVLSESRFTITSRSEFENAFRILETKTKCNAVKKG